MKRLNHVVTPGGTITDTVYDARSNVIGVYIGTDDIRATETDPTGGGTPGNNMVLVTTNVFDDPRGHCTSFERRLQARPIYG